MFYNPHPKSLIINLKSLNMRCMPWHFNLNFSAIIKNGSQMGFAIVIINFVLLSISFDKFLKSCSGFEDAL